MVIVRNKDGTVSREIEVVNGMLREPLVIADTESPQVWVIVDVPDVPPTQRPIDAAALGADPEADA